MAELAALAGMFLAALVAASPLPFQSEVVLAGMITAASAPVWLLVAIASVGNVAGSAVTCALGRGLAAGTRGSRFAPKVERRERAEAWFRRWGKWALLLSWLPLGDVITFVAGTLRTPWPVFLLLTALAKTGRYVALALAVQAAV